MLKLTALEEQYLDIKKQYQDYILLFQLGDFYEMWNSDAEIVSRLIGLTLTRRNNNPMAGIPAGNIDFYLNKMIKEHSLKVAICNQLETPEEAKKNNRSIVNRGVVRILTPGSLVNDNPDNNYILACTFINGVWDLVYIDISTGECYLEQVDNDFLLSTIYRIAPSEILLPKHLSLYLSKFYDDILNLVENSSDAYMIIINYLKSLKIEIDIKPIQVNKKFYMTLGTNTLRNLEVFSDLSGNQKNSLFIILNKTQTPMGKRLLKNMLSNPIYDLNILTERLECVKYFTENITKIDISDIFKQINNIKSLDIIYKIADNIDKSIALVNKFTLPTYLYKMKNYTIECSNVIKSQLRYQDEHLMVKNHELITLQTAKDLMLEKMESIYSKTKLKYNSLLGYFIEVNKNIKMPDEYILKQELSTMKRYTSLQLMDYEQQLYSIQEKIDEIEQEIFLSLKATIELEKNEIFKLSHLIAHIDYFISCAKCAIEYSYTPPIFGDELDIKGARHPIIERYKKYFISNNCYLDIENPIICITGPNMGGKSTYLRSIALIVLMAQCGMYVPASSAKIKLFDALFVRIGAGDNIFTGDSTFQMEMLECAEAIKHGTSNSCVIFDEVGRGTSIKDGISISYSICQYLKKQKIYTLLSTHYLEMLPIEGIKNYRIKVTSSKSEIRLLYELEEGISDNSFGLYVARSVGLNEEILSMSEIVFDKLTITFNK